MRGTRFRLYPQPSFLANFEEPETVFVASAAGSVGAGQMGGHRPKKLIGPWREWLLERCRTADFTLRGLVAELGDRGLPVDYRTVWEFVHAEGLTHKKRR